MTRKLTPALLLRSAVFAVIGVALAALLARASDALWWRALPWVPLALFWTYLIRRYRRGDFGGRQSGSNSPAS